jgi:hypothetical protein
MIAGNRARSCAALAVALLLTIGAPASTVPVQTQGMWPFQLEWTHDGEGVEYHLLCVNGQCTPLAAAQIEGTTWRAPLPMLPRGEYRLVVAACGSGGCTDGTPDISIRILAPQPRRPPLEIVSTQPRRGDR